MLIPIWILPTLALIIFLVLLFLPTLMELKKPKDAGPRRILESPIISTSISRGKTEKFWHILVDIEGGEDTERSTNFTVHVEDLEALPNIEI